MQSSYFFSVIRFQPKKVAGSVFSGVAAADAAGLLFGSTMTPKLGVTLLLLLPQKLFLPGHFLLLGVHVHAHARPRQAPAQNFTAYFVCVCVCALVPLATSDTISLSHSLHSSACACECVCAVHIRAYR